MNRNDAAPSDDAVVRTERLWLRHILPADAPVMYAMNADPEVLRYTGDEPFHDVREARSFIAAYPDYRLHGFGRWAVVRTEDGAVLGWCGLKRHGDGQVDPGYRLLRSAWGRGYATEASKACLEWGFQEAGLDTIIGRVARANTASIRVLEKVGMRFWKEQACAGIQDALVYRLDREGPLSARP